MPSDASGGGRLAGVTPEANNTHRHCGATAPTQLTSWRDRTLLWSGRAEGGRQGASAARLLDAMDSSDVAAQSAMLNPTRIRFSLEGDSFLSFAFVSKFDSRSRKIEAWFRRLWTAAGILTVPPIIGGTAVLVTILINTTWAEMLGWWSIWIGVGSSIASGAFFVGSYAAKHLLVIRSRRYGDRSAVEEFIKQQKKRHERTDH